MEPWCNCSNSTLTAETQPTLILSYLSLQLHYLEVLINLNLHKFEGLKVEGQGRIQEFLMGGGGGGEGPNFTPYVETALQY